MSPVTGIHFAQDMADVVFYRAFREVQLGGDFGVAAAMRQMVQDIAFAAG